MTGLPNIDRAFVDLPGSAALATGALLYVLVTMLGPVSGAQFDPAVSVVAATRGDLAWRDAAAYALAQIVCGILGVRLAHAMFAVPILQVSQHSRTGIGQWAGETVATFALIGRLLFDAGPADARTSVA